jgi:ABC-type transport system substrate-binding protein
MLRPVPAELAVHHVEHDGGADPDRRGSGFPQGAQPYPHDPQEAKRLFEKGGWPSGRPIRIAAPPPFLGIAQLVASHLRRALGVAVEVIAVPEEALLAGSRALVEKKLDQPWDLLVHAWFDLSSEAPPAAVHREFFGTDGAFRVGPPDAGFDELFHRMAVELDGGSSCRSPSRSTRTVSTTRSPCSCARRRRCTR